MRDKVLYKIWDNMKNRCNNINCPKYHRYGERGITVCEDWLKYPAFRDWSLTNGYLKGLSLDRIDNDLGYSPDNCQWITLAENTSKAHKYSGKKYLFGGKSLTLKQWSELLGINLATLNSRLFLSKWSLEKALSIPVSKYNSRNR